MEYNNEFRPSKLTYANGSDTMSYDNDGLLIKQGSFNISHDATNGLALGIDNGTLQSSRTYNSYGELKEIEDKVNSTSTFGDSTTRNKIGKIITKTETIAGQSHDYVYEYNSDGRLTKVTKDGTVVESYSYDANGNRADATVNEDDQVVTYNGTTYSYNTDGYLTSKTDSEGTTTYQYGIWGELQKVVLADGKVVEYLHNANHQRVAKKVDGAVVEKYLWLDLTTLLATYDKDNNLISRFNYADGRMPRSMQRETETYYLHYDQVGTLKLITNSSGATIKEIEYDSFGNILNDSNPSFVVPFGFAGGLYDSDTKLTRFGYRDYDGFSGRWTAKDPIGFSGGDSNLYGYVLGDPVNFVDPSGQFWGAIIGGITGAIIGTINPGAAFGKYLAPFVSGFIGDLMGQATTNVWQDKKDKSFKFQDAAVNSLIGSLKIGSLLPDKIPAIFKIKFSIMDGLRDGVLGVFYEKSKKHKEIPCIP